MPTWVLAWTCYLRPMQSMRRLIGERRGALLAIALGYALAVQALMTCIGMGMSEFAVPAQSGLVICGHISADLPPRDSDGQKRNSAPQCPFCFVAAYSAGNLALSGETPILPVYAGLPSALAAQHFSEPLLIGQRHRTVGFPRAPPSFSI
jgi:hypothetical protein